MVEQGKKLSQGTDELDTSSGAQESVALSLIEGGMFPGVSHISIDGKDGVQKFHQHCDEGVDVLVARVPREEAEKGLDGGAVFAMLLRGTFPASVRGKVLLSFDGWADDKRELFQIEEVVDFCRGLLFLNLPSGPNGENARQILDLLVDEDSRAFEEGELKRPVWLDSAGSVWLCGVCFPEHVFFQERGKWMRNYGRAFQVREWLIGRSGPPSL